MGGCVGIMVSILPSVSPCTGGWTGRGEEDPGELEEGQAVIMALLDNLGKGASGQAIQNLDLMLNLK